MRNLIHFVAATDRYKHASFLILCCNEIQSYDTYSHFDTLIYCSYIYEFKLHDSIVIPYEHKRFLCKRLNLKISLFFVPSLQKENSSEKESFLELEAQVIINNEEYLFTICSSDTYAFLANDYMYSENIGNDPHQNICRIQEIFSCILSGNIDGFDKLIKKYNVPPNWEESSIEL